MFNFEQVMEIMRAFSDSTITEFEFEDDDASFKLKKEETTREAIKEIVHKQVEVPVLMPSQASGTAMSVAPMVAPAQTPVAAPAEAPVASSEVVENCNVVKSPLVGTFYCSASPDAEPFVKVGDKVKKGQVLGIIEAMKLMNDIESDFDGEIVEILVNNKDMVEFEQPLFKIK